MGDRNDVMAPGDATRRYVPLFPYLPFTLGTLAWLVMVVLVLVAAPIIIVALRRSRGRVSGV